MLLSAGSILLFAWQPSEALALFVGAILASSLGLYFKMYEDDIYAPRLGLSSNTPSVNDFDLSFTADTVLPTKQSATYHCNVVKVKNTGLRAAEGCKADLKIGDQLLRVCWTVPAERPSATINALSEEALDVCAVLSKIHSEKKGVPKRIAPVETGWVIPPRDLGKEEIKGQLIISAKNANPKMYKIRILPFDQALEEKVILVIDK